MKQIFTLLACIFSVTQLMAGAPVQFNLHYSEPYAVYDFLAKISDNYPDNDLKNIFSKSKYNTKTYQKEISDFQNLHLNYTYAFEQYPRPLKVAMMSVDLLEKNLAISENMAEFENRSIGIIPNEDLIRLSTIIQRFIPIYHELVFEPNKRALEIQKSNLLNYINTGQFADYFQKGLTFYHTEWGSNIPFELNLLPSLDKGNLGARAFFNVAVCEASLDLKDHKTFFSVAMHEIYHIVYDNQSLEMKANMQQWFNGTNSANSQNALLLLNEVLATALGNAYVMEQLNGHISEDDWYGNKYISGMAQAIYPTVKQYIDNKKAIDEAFVTTYVKMYDAKFGNWAKELNHIFMYRYIVADNNKDWQYFRKTYRYYSNNRLAAPISVTEIEKCKDFPINKVFVISEGNKQKLELLKNNFDELKKTKMDADKEFIEVFALKDRTKLFIINRKQSTVEALMKKYFQDNKIE